MRPVRSPLAAVCLLMTLSGCRSAASTARGVDAPAPVPASADALRTWADASMGEGLRIAADYREPTITSRRVTHAQFWDAVLPLVTNAGFRVEEVGRSVEGRALRTITIGSGPDTVLLWSQMHGDESTATMALADLFRWFANTRGEARDDARRDRLTRGLTLVFLPMLNPDGAERFQRENAHGVDINRDARALATPEGRALKAVRDRLRPAFGFNLHDQSARTRAGRDGPQAGIALLAPAPDAARSWNATRARARLVAATLVASLEGELPRRLAVYDDAFNPRAFGDLMQQWGTSTVLIESGALPGDPEKQRLRALHVGALLTVLDALATGAYRTADAVWYDALPQNAGGAYDLLVRGAQLVLPGRPPARVDVAVNFDDAVARTGGRVREVGDLSAVVAIDTLSVDGLFLHPAAEAVDAGGALRIGAEARFDVRRGAEVASALVRTVGTPPSGRAP
jgi:hypothetical protein